MSHLLPVDDRTSVEVTVRRDFVELRVDSRCVAVIDRDTLRGWLTHPHHRPSYPIDDVTWIHRPDGGVMLTITRIGAWALNPHAVRALVAQL